MRSPSRFPIQRYRIDTVVASRRGIASNSRAIPLNCSKSWERRMNMIAASQPFAVLRMNPRLVDRSGRIYSSLKSFHWGQARLRREATLYLLPPHTAWIFSVISCSAVSVDLIRRAPICVSGRSACVSARCCRRFEITDSSAFPSVFSRAIGLYDSEFEQSLSPSLRVLPLWPF